MAEVVRVLPCPTCRKQVRWDAAPWRPFCSERCKLLDLGAWAEGRYAVPGEPADPQVADRESGHDTPRS